jgi:hypothetical protein
LTVCSAARTTRAVQADSAGRIWLVEDSGGAFGTANPNAKQPNSFVYRFTPSNPDNLQAGGKLEALQVISLRSGNPIVFHDGQVDQDITSPDRRDLHTYGKQFQTTWVTVHDNATDGMATFDANALAKAQGATPFKRPENGVFRPVPDSASSCSQRPVTPTRCRRPARRVVATERCTSSASPAPARRTAR